MKETLRHPRESLPTRHILTPEEETKKQKLIKELTPKESIYNVTDAHEMEYFLKHGHLPDSECDCEESH